MNNKGKKMKLIIVRHGDPDYSIDSLTEVGKKEAELLAARMDKTQLDDVYVSPLGRAKLTAQIALKNKGIVPTECDWLREFGCSATNPSGAPVIWDLMPGYYAEHRAELDGADWQKFGFLAKSDIAEAYGMVTRGVDEILFRHGYKRNGFMYDAVKPSYDTVALFCHFGVESVILSHILGVSPYLFFQGFCALPTSVTTLVTEEREQGKAVFRCLAFGDTSHLYAGGREPSFAGRFAEIHGNGDRI